MADPLLVPVDGKGLDWPRKVANAVNTVRRLFSVAQADIDTLKASRPFPFDSLPAAPSGPAEGQSYYDTTTHKARTWDGSAWNDLW